MQNNKWNITEDVLLTKIPLGQRITLLTMALHFPIDRKFKFLPSTGACATPFLDDLCNLRIEATSGSLRRINILRLWLAPYERRNISYNIFQKLRIVKDSFLACRSHFSTDPCAVLGLNLSTSGTTSPSAEIMAVMSRLCWNSSRLIPSKHFFKWGCTRNGSFVSDRISSISSFERKKNRGNAILFTWWFVIARRIWTLVIITQRIKENHNVRVQFTSRTSVYNLQ